MSNVEGRILNAEGLSGPFSLGVGHSIFGILGLSVPRSGDKKIETSGFDRSWFFAAAQNAHS